MDHGREIAEYKRLMEQAPQIKATDLEGDYPRNS